MDDGLIDRSRHSWARVAKPYILLEWMHVLVSFDAEEPKPFGPWIVAVHAEPIQQTQRTWSLTQRTLGRKPFSSPLTRFHFAPPPPPPPFFHLSSAPTPPRRLHAPPPRSRPGSRRRTCAPTSPHGELGDPAPPNRLDAPAVGHGTVVALADAAVFRIWPSTRTRTTRRATTWALAAMADPKPAAKTAGDGRPPGSWSSSPATHGKPTHLISSPHLQYIDFILVVLLLLQNRSVSWGRRVSGRRRSG
jgi:hypothetical protein